MRAKHRDLTEKYKSIRYQPDALYLSRLFQTFFNKFTKQGKKATGRRHLFAALTSFRLLSRRPEPYFAIMGIFRRLHVQFLLCPVRQGRKILDVPTPVRRNKRDVINVQTLYKAITARRERTLSERIYLELIALTFKHRQAPTMRARSAQLALVYQERANMEKR